MHGHIFVAKAEPNTRILRLGGVKGEKNFINCLWDDIHTIVAKLENRALTLVEVSRFSRISLKRLHDFVHCGFQSGKIATDEVTVLELNNPVVCKERERIDKMVIPFAKKLDGAAATDRKDLPHIIFRDLCRKLFSGIVN